MSVDRAARATAAELVWRFAHGMAPFDELEDRWPRASDAALTPIVIELSLTFGDDDSDSVAQLIVKPGVRDILQRVHAFLCSDAAWEWPSFRQRVVEWLTRTHPERDDAAWPFARQHDATRACAAVESRWLERGAR